MKSTPKQAARWPGWAPVHGAEGFAWAVRFKEPDNPDNEEVEYARWEDLGLPSPLEDQPPPSAAKRKPKRE